jgi:hypothetical protein
VRCFNAMDGRPPTNEPIEPEQPSSHWLWAVVILGVPLLVIAGLYMFFTSRREVAITIEGTPTAVPVARVVITPPGLPATVVPPTLPASANLMPTSTAVPVAPPDGPADDAPQAQPPQAEGEQAEAGVGVAGGMGAGYARGDFDSDYGPPTGETPDHLVAYRRNPFDYYVSFTPDANGRAAVIVQQPQSSATRLTIEQAMAEARKLLPKDAQPPKPRAEGNDHFVVERFTSQSLAQALPSKAFTANNGMPGQLLVVYLRDAVHEDLFTGLIVGPGNDPGTLINQAR